MKIENFRYLNKFAKISLICDKLRNFVAVFNSFLNFVNFVIFKITKYDFVEFIMIIVNRFNAFALTIFKNFRIFRKKFRVRSSNLLTNRKFSFLFLCVLIVMFKSNYRFRIFLKSRFFYILCRICLLICFLKSRRFLIFRRFLVFRPISFFFVSFSNDFRDFFYVDFTNSSIFVF